MADFTLAIGSNGGITTQLIPSGAPLLSLVDGSNTIAYNPDGSRIATVSGGNELKIFDAETGTLVRSIAYYTTINSITFSPDGSCIAAGSGDGLVNVWDSSSGVNLMTLNGHSNSIKQVAYSPDGSLLASTSRDMSFIMWEAATGEKITTHPDISVVNCIAFTPDSKRVTSGSVAFVRTIDLSRKVALNDWRSSNIPNCMAYCSDGERLVIGFFAGLKILHVSSGTIIHTFEDTKQVLSVSISSNGRLLAAGGAFGYVTIRWLDDGEAAEVFTLPGNDIQTPSVGVVFRPQSSSEVQLW